MSQKLSPATLKLHDGRYLTTTLLFSSWDEAVREVGHWGTAITWPSQIAVNGELKPLWYDIDNMKPPVRSVKSQYDG